MKVANKMLVKELLTKGYILEFDFHTKCYLCDSEYNRLYAVRFDTYISLVSAMEKFHRNEQYSMTDSDYYRLSENQGNCNYSAGESCEEGEDKKEGGTVCKSLSPDIHRSGIIGIIEKIQDEELLKRIYGLAEYLYLYET